MNGGDAYPFKLGRHEAGLGVIEHRYDNVYQADVCAEAPSLAIACEKDQVALVVRLARLISGPLRIVYVLLVPFSDYAEGRYVFTETFDHESLKVFLDGYCEFFERDARHHIVVGNLADTDRLTYDQHNFICVVGPTAEARDLLDREGFKPGPVELPIPHSHHHHEWFDAAATRFLASHAWTFAPLLESD